MHPSRHPALCALPLLLALTSAAAADDPVEWRDRRPRCPSAEWDALEGEPAPSLAELSGWLNSEPLDWASLHGKVVLIDMWGTWCNPCLKSLPHLVELHERFADRGLVVLGVHSKRGSDRLPSFAAGRNLPHPLAVDSMRALEGRLHLKFWPTYFIVGRDGRMRVAGVNMGKDERGEPWLDRALETILAEPWESGWPAVVEKKLYGKDVRGQAAPPLEVETWLTEEPDLEGKCVLIDLWATWCGPCKRAMPKLEALHEKYGDDLVVIGLSDQHPDAPNRKGEPWGPVVAEYVAAQGFTYYQALDGQGRTKRALEVRGIPHVLLLDSRGIVRWQGVPEGKVDPLTDEVVAAVIATDRAQRAEQDPAPAADSSELEWPPHVQKRLWAEKDLRGRPAPACEVASWLTEEPSREGKVLLFDFWATWCPPCRRLIPELNDWQERFADDLVVIGISAEESATVQDFLERTQVDYALALDPEKRMSQAIGVEGLPHVVVVDSQGIVRWQGFPLSDEDRLTTATLERIIELDRRQREAKRQ